jgi:hypothetical protein
VKRRTLHKNNKELSCRDAEEEYCVQDHAQVDKKGAQYLAIRAINAKYALKDCLRGEIKIIYQL